MIVYINKFMLYVYIMKTFVHIYFKNEIITKIGGFDRFLINWGVAHPVRDKKDAIVCMVVGTTG